MSTFTPPGLHAYQQQQAAANNAAAANTGFFGDLFGAAQTGLSTWLGYRIQRETIEDQIKLANAEQRLAESQRNAPERAGTASVGMMGDFNWKPWAIGVGVFVTGAVVLKKIGVF